MQDIHSQCENKHLNVCDLLYKDRAVAKAEQRAPLGLPDPKVPAAGEEEPFAIFTFFSVCLLTFSKSQLPGIDST